MAGINRNFFFDRVRTNVFAGSLSSAQRQGMEFLLDAWETAYSSGDDRWLAYALATTFHETAFTMRPIRERGGNAYFFRMYDKDGDRPAVAKRLGNVQAGDGILFHGRGYVQLTGRSNYTRLGARLGIDFTSNQAAADRAMQPDVAVHALFWGMEVGLYTGKKLSDYFNQSREDSVNARRIINGLDRADKIASYWREFYGAISHTV